MLVHIPYGDKTLTAHLPAGSDSLNIREPAQRMSAEYFQATLRDRIQHSPLDLRDTVIIVADKTRLCGYPQYLPILVDTLKEYCLAEDALRCIIAYGTHPRQSDEECLAGYGDIYTRYPFVHHDCTDRSLFSECGTTSRGVPIRLRRDILAASCVITMGPICHHYFAGYGGGRKLIFPGCGERHSIYANHSLYLDQSTMSLASGCRPGVLQGNPLAEDLFEIAAYKEADLAIHGILNSHGELCDIVVGSGRNSYLMACEIHSNLCESQHHAVPLLVASCGGYPKDINFIQSHKAIHNASMFVQDGGTLVIFSECRDGLGSETFLPWYSMGGFSKAFHHLLEDYQGNGGTALAMMSKTSRIHIIMVTELEEHICSTIGVEKWSSEKALQYIAALQKPLSYIGNASLLVRRTPDCSLG
jgi:nickel-dependent lactate racemase